MTTTYIPAGSARTSLPTRASNLLRRYFDAYCARRIRRGLRAALDGMSDQELKDIGITRGEIDHVVRADPSRDPRNF